MKQLKEYKPRVYGILEKYPETRDCDKVLTAKYIELFHSELLLETSRGLSLPLINWTKLPPLDTILRNRRVIQNQEGKFLPSDPKIAKMRKQKELDYEYAEARETTKEPVRKLVTKTVDGKPVACWVNADETI